MKIKLGMLLLAVVLCTACTKSSTSEYDVNDQYYWNRTNISACDEGYYICQSDTYTVDLRDAYGNVIPSIDGFQVFFYDIEANEMVAWCDRVDCTHSNVFCNSFFENESWLQQVYYYDGSVYMISMDDDYYFLEQFDQSGNNQRRVGAICTLDKLNTDFGLRFYDQTLYFCKTGEDAGLYEKKLSGMSEETAVISIEEYQSFSRNRFQIMDGVIYYGLLERGDDIYGTSFWKMNIKDKTQEQLFTADTKVLSAAFAEGAVYYYEDGRGLIRVITETGQEECIYEESGETERNVYYDGVYLYLDNVTAGVTYWDEVISGNAREDDPDACVFYKVFSPDGTLVDQIGVSALINNQVVEYLNAQGLPLAFYGDNRYMFMWYHGDENLLAFDKAQIGSKEQCWSRLDWSRASFDYSENAVYSGGDLTAENAVTEISDFSERILYTEEEYEALKEQAEQKFLKETGQSYAGYSMCAFLDNRMYYVAPVSYDPQQSLDSLINTFRICWYDLDTGEEGVLERNGEAYFPYSLYGTAIFAWNDSLYILQREDGDWWLAQLTPETGETTLVCRMEAAERIDTSSPEEQRQEELPESFWTIEQSLHVNQLVRLYQGAIYCLLDGGTRLVRIDIASGVSEELYHADNGWQLSCFSLQFWGDWIYFETQPAELGARTFSLMRYSVSQGISEQLLKYTITAGSGENNYAVLTDECILYYVPEMGIMEYNPVTKEEKPFCTQTPLDRFTESCSVYYDGMFVYLSNTENATEAGEPYSNRVYIMDCTGRMISYISFCSMDEVQNNKKVYGSYLLACGNPEVIYGGCWIVTNIGNDKIERMVLDKEKLFVEGIEEWTTLTSR